MDADPFRTQLNCLLECVLCLTKDEQDQLRDIIQKDKLYNDTHDRVGTIMSMLSILSVSNKYVVFDLEATRREREVLRKKLDS